MCQTLPVFPILLQVCPRPGSVLYIVAMLYMVAESSNCIHAICTQEHASTQHDANIVDILLVLMWDGLAKVCGWLHVACCTQCAVHAACVWTVCYVQHASDSVP